MRGMKMGKGLEDRMYEGWLRALHLLGKGQSRLRGGLMALC